MKKHAGTGTSVGAKPSLGGGSNFYHGKDLGRHKIGIVGHGGPSSGADSSWSRLSQRIYEKDDEEEDMSEDENQELYENILADLLGKAKSGTKDFFSNIGIPGITRRKAGNIAASGIYSVPFLGDLLAAFFFIKNIRDLRQASNKFTKKLSDITGVNLGKDFLEPEGDFDRLKSRIESGDVDPKDELDHSLNLVYDKMTNPQLHKDMKITEADIEELRDIYDEMLDETRAIFLAFFGGIDVFLGQFGLVFNITLSLIEPEDIVNEIIVKHGQMMSALRKSGYFNTVLKIIEKLSLPGDYIGNVDLLFNVRKLERLVLVNKILDHYGDISTKEKQAALGMDVEGYLTPTQKLDLAKKGTEDPRAQTLLSYLPTTDDELRGLKAIVQNKLDLGDEFFESIDFENIVKRNRLNILETLSYLDEKEAEIIDDSHCNTDTNEMHCGGKTQEAEEMEEMNVVANIAGATTPLGTDAKGNPGSKKKRKKTHRIKEEVQNIQNWSHKTSGKIKY